VIFKFFLTAGLFSTKIACGILFGKTAQNNDGVPAAV